jgi:hypothetical protein
MMLHRFFRCFAPAGALFLALCWHAPLKAAPPTLLQEAFENWAQGKDDLSFVQRTRFLNDDGSLKEERLERYDPSLPDNKRWELLEMNGKTPSDSQRERIQDRRNKKPRKKANKPLEEYFELETAKVMENGQDMVRYEVAVRPEAARLIAVDKLSVGISVRKDTKTIERIVAGLTEPMRIAMGVAKVTDIDLDLRFDDEDESSAKDKNKKSAEPPSEADGTARVVMSKLGNRAEYTWGEFKRVSRYRASGAKSGDARPENETGEIAEAGAKD